MMKPPSSLLAVLLLLLPKPTESEPTSRPYIPLLTSPFDQPSVSRNVTSTTDAPPSRPDPAIHPYVPPSPDGQNGDVRCPLQFRIGLSHHTHGAGSPVGRGLVEPGVNGIHAPPIVYPLHPSSGPGRDVLYTSDFEHLDLLSPSLPTNGRGGALQEMITESHSFPLLFESSSFYHTSPLIHDVNGDGVEDALLADYDGGIHVVGLTLSPNSHRRYVHRIQVPRLHMRREWIECRSNKTREESDVELDPYHSYFEYDSESKADKGKKEALRGVNADVLGQAVGDVAGLEERRLQRAAEGQSDKKEKGGAEGDGMEAEGKEEGEEEQPRRRLQEAEGEEKKKNGDGAVTDGDKGGNVGSKDEKGQEPAKTAVTDEKAEQPKTTEETAGEKTKDAAEAENARQQQEESASPEKADGNKDDGNKAQVDDAGENESTQTRVDRRGGRDGSGSHVEEEYSDSGDEEEDEYDSREDDYDSREFPEEHWDSRDLPGRDEYPSYDDMYGGDDEYRSRGYHGDDYFGEGGDHELHSQYYDDANYIWLPPHILSTPVMAEVPKLYKVNSETEPDDALLVMAVSYYFDEDEYDGRRAYRRFENEGGGDEDEEKRGRYVANALAVYNLNDMRWSHQVHLDLSGDYTAPSVLMKRAKEDDVKTVPVPAGSDMGAFALASPTVADVDGDENFEMIVGTSMGMVHMLGVNHGSKKEGFPVQMPYPIEHRILLEDVMGDTNLEIFVADVGGNVACLDVNGKTLWHRDSLAGMPYVKVMGSSPLAMGDINGDGTLDLVFVLRVKNEKAETTTLIYAISAKTGDDLPHFPMQFNAAIELRWDRQHERVRLPAPLLVDMHSDQKRWLTYIRRNGTAITPEHQEEEKKKAADKPAPQGGFHSPGLHIVQPLGPDLYIIEGGSGCTQTVTIGETVEAQVQVDDVHGTGGLDLVVTTVSGNVLTLESESVPYHPLNVWSSGETRGENAFVQGYSASQGIYVHEVSRRYRDVLGIYVPVTFEIFDNRPNISNEPEKRKYRVEVRVGTSMKRAAFRKYYNQTGVYTERVYVPHGPGHYALMVRLVTSHGLVYTDVFHLGYNVHYMDGMGSLLWLPLILAAVPLLVCGRRKPARWDDEEYDGDELAGARDANGGSVGGRGLGILGRALPS